MTDQPTNRPTGGQAGLQGIFTTNNEVASIKRGGGEEEGATRNRKVLKTKIMN